MDRAAMLRTMAKMQEAHNHQVHSRWRDQHYEYYRAIWIECAEMLEHFGWKWWQKPDRKFTQVKLELIDIWHFGLSDLLRGDVLSPTIAQTLDVEPLDFPGEEALRDAVEALALDSLASQAFDVKLFAKVMAALPLSFNELFLLYMAKNVLNEFRQNNGYKEGTYRKKWQGREDNEHLVELLEEIDTQTMLKELPAEQMAEQLERQLHPKLKSRYRESSA